MKKAWKIKRVVLQEDMFDVIRRNVENYAAAPKSKKWKAKRSKKKRPVRRLKYAEYMASKAWRTRRRTYFKKHKKICAACGSETSITLHHTSYKNLGHEPDTDLVPLCWACHEEYHDEYGTKQLVTTYKFIEERQQEVTFRNMVRNF